VTATQVLGFKLDSVLIARQPDERLDHDALARARAAAPDFADALTAEQVRLGVLRQDARVDQLVGVWGKTFDFEIRATVAESPELVVFVRSVEDWLRFLDLCADTVLVDAQTGEGVTAGKFEIA